MKGARYGYETRKTGHAISRKPQTTPESDLRSSDKGSCGTPHFFILAGHSRYDTGAVANGLRENEVTIELRNLVLDEMRILTGSVSSDDDMLSLRDVVNWLYRTSTEGDVLCEIHCNAADNPKATGCEVLIPDYYDPKEMQIAEALVLAVSNFLGIRNRGVKTARDSERKQLAIMGPKGANILLEAFFLTNKSDVKAYQEKKFGLARVIVQTLYNNS